jgi:precorrin-2 dehydrogenase/sirohydrochlorin ferrochelatase
MFSYPHYPVFINLKGRKVVIAGGGKACAIKLKSLLASGAVIEIVSPTLTHSLEELLQKGVFTWVNRTYQDGDLAGATLAFATTDDADTNQAVVDAAAKLNILANRCDHPARGHFINGAWHFQNFLSIAVSTEGASPKAAQSIRNYLSNDSRLKAVSAKLKRLATLREQKVHQLTKTELKEKDRLEHDVNDILSGSGSEP